MTDSKQQAKQRNQLKQFQNRLTIQFQTGLIKTWTDFNKFNGSDTINDKEILWPELKQYLQQQKDTLENSFKAQSSQVEPTTGICVSEQLVQPEATEKSQQDTAQTVSLQLVPVISSSKDDSKQSGTTVVLGAEEQISLRAKDITKVSSPELIEFNKDSYGLFESDNWTVFHYWFQKKAIRELIKLIVGLDPAHYPNFKAFKEAFEDPTVIKRPKSGILLLAPTGTGKTYMLSALFRVLMDLNYQENRTWSHIPYLVVTKSTVIEQFSRVLKGNYHLEPNADVEVINLEMLRSSQGRLWIMKDEKIVNGEEVLEYKWKPNMNPCVVGLDESQGTKNVGAIRNRGSAQGQIMCAYADIKRFAQLICVSATPFVRVCEAKCFAVSTHKDITYILGTRSPFPEGTKLTNDNWPTYAGIISSPASPFDYVQASVERLCEDLKDYIIRVTGVKPQFKGKNRTKVIPFPSEESRLRYASAWDTYCERKAKIDAMKGVEGAQTECIFAVITALTMAAEKEHAESWANETHKWVEEGYAAVVNAKFKGTIIACVKHLITKFGVTRDQISIIWGGGQTQLTEKQKNRDIILKKKATLEAMGMSAEEILEDMGLDDVDERVIEDFPPEWRLGVQTKEDRQIEIDNFQSGKTLYCFYTLGAGGVGLSLHHTDELVPQTYGRMARVALEQEKHVSMDDKLSAICFSIGQNNIDKATKLWNKYEGSIPNQLHHILVRILRCRRKESGFTVEEDIPYNPVRQRKTKGTLSFNPIQLVQSVGRVPRLTSQSDTEQEIDVFIGTWEVRMGMVVSQKLRCLSSVVKVKEDWQDIIMGGRSEEAMANKVKQLIQTSEGMPDDDSGIVDEGEQEEEE